MITEEQVCLLQKPLDLKHVKVPTGQYGPKGDYIEGWHAINEANRIFGYDGWSYTILSLAECAKPYENANKNWVVSYICTISLEIGQCIRQDVGYGSGASKQIGDAHESAAKEAVTDALKRALRTYGNQFGLALYDKQRSNVTDGSPQPEKVSAAEMKRGLEQMDTELIDCNSIVTFRKLKFAWKETMDFQMWTQDYRDEATKKFASRLEIINSKPEQEQEAA